MLRIQNGFKISLFLFMTNVLSSLADPNGQSDFLATLLNNTENKDVRGGQVQKVINAIDDASKKEKFVPSRREQDAYVFYNILRCTQEEEDLDAHAVDVFQRTQNILRKAFALRCAARDSCERRCPPPREECEIKCGPPRTKRHCNKLTCPTTENPCKTVCKPKKSQCKKECLKDYDELDACNGDGGDSRTRPSRWLRSFLLQPDED